MLTNGARTISYPKEKNNYFYFTQYEKIISRRIKRWKVKNKSLIFLGEIIIPGLKRFPKQNKHTKTYERKVNRENF